LEFKGQPLKQDRPTLKTKMATEEWIMQSPRLQYESLEQWIRRLRRLHRRLYGLPLSRACESKIRDKFAQWYYCGQLDVGSKKMGKNLARYVVRQVVGGNAKDTWAVFDTVKNEVRTGSIKTRREARGLARELNAVVIVSPPKEARAL
jgi:hypothetical protein